MQNNEKEQQNATDRPVGWEADRITQAFTETGIKFTNSLADTLAAFKSGDREVTFDENGEPFAIYDQETLPLTQALTRWAFDADGVCDRRSLPREGAGGGRRGVMSKADLATYKEKSAFIAKNGLSAYEALPLTPLVSNEVKYREDYWKLPRETKVRLTERYGADYAGSLPSRPTGQSLGSYVNHEALEKARSIRPGGR